MNFSEALQLIKNGKKLTRSNWNGNKLHEEGKPARPMFVYLVHGSEFEVNRAPLNAVYEMGTKIKYRPHIDLCAADGTCGVWSISNLDALSDDWEVVE
jgi:hypothetical protein